MKRFVHLPRQGESVKYCTLTEWKIKEGDQIDKGDAIAVIETDKASFDLESTEAGTVLKLHGKSGDKIEVLSVLAEIGEEYDLHMKPVTSKVELSIVDLAEIAKEVLCEFPYSQYDEIKDFLEGGVEIRNALKELNEKIRTSYEKATLRRILAVKGETYDMNSAPKIVQELVSKAMELGLRSVLKKYIPESSSQTSISGGQEIEGKGTWDDIKGRI